MGGRSWLSGGAVLLFGLLSAPGAGTLGEEGGFLPAGVGLPGAGWGGLLSPPMFSFELSPGTAGRETCCVGATVGATTAGAGRI